MSLLPPGANGTMILMAFGDASWAKAAPSNNKRRAVHLHKNKKDAFIDKKI
jgi:hypothetical protein